MVWPTLGLRKAKEQNRSVWKQETWVIHYTVFEKLRLFYFLNNTVKSELIIKFDIHGFDFVRYTWKASPHYLVKCWPLSSDNVTLFPPKWMVRKIAHGYAVLRKIELWISSVTGAVKSDHLLRWHALPVFFAAVIGIIHHTVLALSPCLKKASCHCLKLNKFVIGC